MALIGYLRGAGAGPTDWPDGGPGVLAGRAREVSVLRDALDRLAGGTAQLIEVTGEPGIGKSRLLAECARQAAERGLLVHAGLASEAGGRVPFGPLVDALDDHLAEDVGRLDVLGPDAQDLLRLIFPALSAHGEPSVRALGQAGYYRLQRAVRGLFEAIAMPGLVLILDDLHWADEESVKLLTDLIRRPPQAPVLFVLAYRQRQAPALLRTAVAAAAGGMPVRQLELDPLSEDEAELVLGGRGTRSWRRAVYRESGGNPFYLDALARTSLRHPGRGPASGDDELPGPVQAALQAELEGTSPAARLVARAAAVAGEQFAPAFVAEIAGCPEPEVLTAIDELVSRDLIRQGADGQRFAFRHAFVRQATYASSSPGWRLAAHSRAADALRRHGAPAVSLAYHVELAARPGDLAAVEVLDEAASAIRLQAPATAANWLRAAARLLPHDGTAEPQRLALLVRLAKALGAAGYLQESRDAIHAALRLLPRDKPAARAGAVAFGALMDRLLGRPAEAEALLRDELRAIEGEDTVARASLMFELACGKLGATDSATCVDLASDALAAARRHGSRQLQAAALGLMAMAHAAAAETTVAATQLDEAADLLDAMLDEAFGDSLDAVLWVSWAEIVLERWDDALRHLDRAMVFARGSGRALILPHLLVGRVLVLRVQGRLAEAKTSAEDAVDLARLAGSDEQLVSALSMQCWVATWIGDPDTAVDAGLRALERGEDDGATRWCTTLAARMLAEARLGAGDADGCLALLDIAGGPGLLSAEACSRVAWYELMTRAELSSGAVPAAARWAELAEQAAARLNLPGRGGLARLARAQVQAVTDARAAVASADAAAEALETAGMLVDATRARLVGATALATLGDTDRASARLKQAQTAFESFGAHTLARQALGERRRLAARSSRKRFAAPTTGLAALTRREQQVATLVSQGLTNRGIAQQLYVTEKTVEMHLTNVFAKLGVTSRASVASAVTRAVGA